eukprot:3584603-Karenia_brevis.AAC.1
MSDVLDMLIASPDGAMGLDVNIAVLEGDGYEHQQIKAVVCKLLQQHKVHRITNNEMECLAVHIDEENHE